MAFMDSLAAILNNSPTPTQRIDIRAPETVAMDRMRLQLASQYGQRLTQAEQDPSYAIGTPEQNTLMEQELADQVRNRTGASGAGGSGYESDSVRKAIIDFRINQIARRQQALESLRTATTNAATPSSWGQQQTQPYQQGVIPQSIRQFAGNMTLGAGNAARTSMFGPQSPTDAQVDSQQPGGQPGTTGYRPNASWTPT